jgi:aspartyl-tRNA(Asn)/glutamyl-tRNA(Gln) amidotransferase subunit C
MAIDVPIDRVRATADLARLDLRDDEVAPFAAQLQKILDHIADLDSLDTSAVDAAAGVPERACPMQPDVPRRGVDRDEALAQAPRSERGAFVVPRFVEE